MQDDIRSEKLIECLENKINLHIDILYYILYNELKLEKRSKYEHL